MNDKIRLYSVLFILSVATLTLEILQLRIFAYSLLRSLAHIVVSIVLLGIGIGSISIALTSNLHKIKEEKLLTGLLIGFSVSVLGTHFIFSYFFEWINQGYNFPRLWLFSIIFSVPYIFFGAVLTYVFKKYVEDVPKLYAVNLTGSGIGCLIPLLALRPLGAEILIVVVSIMGAVCSLVYALKVSKKLTSAVSVVTLFMLLCIPLASELFQFKSKPLGGLSKMAKATAVKRNFSTWDPLGRIEVYSFDDKYSYMYMPEAVPIKAMFQDGDAGSMLVNIREDIYDYTHFYDGSIFSLVYQLRQNPETLAIGLGGGHDIMRASHFKSSHVTGVEINSTTVKLVKEIFKDFLGDPYGRENVNIINMDGRYFVRDDTKKYDIIQIAGADTDTSNLTSGALSVSENYLYTTEAFRDYFSSLKPDGILSLIRFGPREPMLIMTTALTAMREMGIPDPHRNFMVVKQAINVNVLMKKAPFSIEEIDALQRFVEKVNVSAAKLRLPVNDVIGYEAINSPEIMYLPLTEWKAENSFTELMTAVQSREEAAYVSRFPSNISPLSDNMPFFFQYEKPENIFKYRNSVIYNLFKSIIHISLFSIALIFLPAWLLKRKHTKITYHVHFIIYFLCIGIGFMLIEIGLIQKSVLFLGHPTYSFIAVVFSILLFSGLGSLASGMFKGHEIRLIIGSIAFVVIISLIYLFYMENVLNAVLPENTFMRMLIISLFLSPLGFAMGIPFPKGLQLVNNRDRNFIPIAMATNSVASVLAAASSLPFAMVFGFSTIFLTAVFVYFMGLVAVLVKR